MAWLVMILVLLLALLIFIKVIQILFGLIAIAIILIAFVILRARFNEWWSGRSRPREPAPLIRRDGPRGGRGNGRHCVALVRRRRRDH